MNYSDIFSDEIKDKIDVCLLQICNGILEIRKGRKLSADIKIPYHVDFGKECGFDCFDSTFLVCRNSIIALVLFSFGY